MKKIEKIIIIITILIAIIAAGVVIYTKKDSNPLPLELDKPSDNPVKPNEPRVYNDTGFNVRLIKTVNSSYNSNYLISPYSIEIALNMLKDGASGNTLTEIENVVGARDINAVSSDVKVANAMFVNNKYKKDIKDSFYSLMKTNYDSEIIYDEFKTPAAINNWVNKKTSGMIKEVLDKISSDFVLGLANALAIDVKWESQFKCENTSSKEFTKADGTKYNVEMMYDTYKSDDYKYFELDDAKGVILPYYSDDEDTHLEFVGILPNGDVSSYIESLTEEKLNSIDANLKSAGDNVEIVLSLPRFSYSFNLQNFMEVLETMGIKDAFDSSHADFSNISTNVPLYVAIAIHKTYIDLNEKGTKAAAVTFFGLEKSMAPVETQMEKFEIVFNKPFAYLIRDSKTKEILFFGVTYEPKEWKGSTCEKD